MKSAGLSMLVYQKQQHTKALAQIGLFVDEDFGRDHVSERHEHLQDVLVSKLLGKVVDEQISPFRSW